MGRKKRTSKKPNFSISLVIPCYNERNRLETLFDAVAEFAAEWTAPFELIIVDDGSEDGTPEQVEQQEDFIKWREEGNAKLLIQPKNMGKGAALKRGVSAAECDFVLTLDADMSMRPVEVIKWWQYHPERFGANKVLVASREHPYSEVSSNRNRLVPGRIFNFIIRTLTSLEQRDTQCGFKLYPAGLAKDLFDRLGTAGWAHDVELLYRAKLKDVRVYEMPIVCKHFAEGSKINVFRDSLSMLWQLAMIVGKLNWQYFISDPILSLGGRNARYKTGGEYPIFRTLFVLLVLFLFVFMPLISTDYGITGDARVQYFYGEHLLDYFTTFGEDKTAQQCCPEAPDITQNLHYYGGFFELLTAAVNHTFGIDHPFLTRHAINAFFGFLAILFAGLLGVYLKNYTSGFIIMSILTLTPRFFGHSMNNPKDIPFAAAYMIAIYFLFKVIKKLPRPSKRDLFWLIAAIALSISIRVGGILLIAYSGLFLVTEVLSRPSLRRTLSDNYWKYIKIGLPVAILGYFGGLIFWPYAHQDPIGNPLTALDQMEQFRIAVRLIFEGQYIQSSEVPWYYVIKYLWITLPLVFLAGIFLFPFTIKRLRIQYWRTALLIFTVAFPVAYVIYKSSTLYDGVRHFLFVIPPLACLAGLAWTEALEYLRNGWPKITGGVVFSALLFMPLQWMVSNHPNQVVYFNQIEGGVQGAFAEYELDYWQNSGKAAVKWLVDNRDLPDTTMIVSNLGGYPIRKYFDEFDVDVENLNTQYAKYTSADEWTKNGNKRFSNWDYAVFYARYVPLDELRKYWPHSNTIYAERAGGVPLTIVIERKSKADLKGYQAMQNQNWRSAARHFQAYVQADPNSALIWYYLGLSYFNLQSPSEAISAFEQSLDIRPEGVQPPIFGNLARSYLGSGQVQKALNWSNKIVQNKQVELRNVENKLRSEDRIDPMDYYHYVDLLQVLAELTGIQAQAYSQLNQNKQADRAQRLNNRFQRAFQQARKRLQR